MLSRSATRVNSNKPCLLPTITLRFTCGEQRIGQTSKISKYYEHDCRLDLVTNIFQCQTNGKEKIRKKTKNKEVYQKKRTKISKEIRKTKLYFHYNITLINTESNRNISIILSKTTI